MPPEIKAIGKNISFDIHVIFDDLVMREQEGLEQPEWLTDELQEEIKKLGKISFDGFLGTQKLQKLNAGIVYLMMHQFYLDKFEFFELT